MTRGLVRKNNLSDLISAEQSRDNLGLATADYNRIRGLFTSAGVSNLDVQKIAGASNNYQSQIDSINSNINEINPGIYANRIGDTLSGVWTNTGRIGAITITVSGSIPTESTDSLFTHDYQAGIFQLTTNNIEAPLGMTVESISDGGGIVFTSGVTTNKKVPIKIANVPYFLEAG